MANKIQTYLLFAIGPVQEFLAAARKTSDLYAGSLLLSHLANQALQIIGAHAEDIFYPVVDKSRTTDAAEFSAISNRIFCRLEGDEEKAMRIASKAERRVKAVFRDQAGTDAMNTFAVPTRDRVWSKLWQEQLDKFLELYYAAYQPRNGESHDQCYRQLEYLLACRKLLRDFQEQDYFDTQTRRHAQGQPEQKCALILHHTALHTQDKRPRQFWQEQAQKSAGVYRRGERLSAIAVTKRRFLSSLVSKKLLKHDRFTPTNTIAVGGFYRALVHATKNSPDLQEAGQEYTRDLRKLANELKAPQIGNFPSLTSEAPPELTELLTIDTMWLEPDKYDVQALAEEYGKDARTLGPLVKTALKSRNQFFRRIKDFNREQTGLAIPPPGKYYAIIAFDGDQMGKWLSGSMENENGEKFSASEENHRKLSQNLHSFSTDTIPDIFHGKNKEGVPRLGRLIYAGGDDILAFCALDDLFEILSHLNAAFREAMHSATGGFSQATGSAGIAIAHPRTSLQQVLQEARDTVRFAKQKLERDSLVFSLVRRSGERTSVGMCWDHQGFPNVVAMQAFARCVQNGHVSTSFLYDLKSESFGLDGLTNVPDVMAEIKRLMKRHSGQSDESKSKVKSLFEKQLMPFYRTLYVTSLTLSETTISRFISLLEIAQFTGRGGAE